MKKPAISILIILLLLSACAKPAAEDADPAARWQQQYDLGVRYLSEGNYQEAIIAFTAAIEIDPKNAEAYLELYNAYIAAGDLDAAEDTLRRGSEATEDERLNDLLSRFTPVELELGGFYTYDLAASLISVKYSDHTNPNWQPEDAVGMVGVTAIAEGPENVRTMHIWKWREEPYFTAELPGIMEKASESFSKRRGTMDLSEPPFERGMYFTVKAEDLGKTYYVLIVALDENATAVGCAITRVEIPAN